MNIEVVLKYIMRKYREYDVKYNHKSHILHINKPIPIKTYLLIKDDISTIRSEIKNIIIGVEEQYRIRSRNG